MGSKNRHAKDILPYLAKDYGKLYLEPFCGGCNIIDKILGDRWGNDIDEDLICLWQAVSDGWLPPQNFTEEEYNLIKTQPTSPLKGYAAFALSYGAKKWGGWRRDKEGKRDYVAEAYRNAIKQFPKLKGVKFTCDNYINIDVSGAIIYCDPPYENTTKYNTKFNHQQFWDWCREMSKKNMVYVSEYNAPEDFECVWYKQVNSSLTKNTGGKKNVEKLFRLYN